MSSVTNDEIFFSTVSKIWHVCILRQNLPAPYNQHYDERWNLLQHHERDSASWSTKGKTYLLRIINIVMDDEIFFGEENPTLEVMGIAMVGKSNGSSNCRESNCATTMRNETLCRKGCHLDWFSFEATTLCFLPPHSVEDATFFNGPSYSSISSGDIGSKTRLK